MHFRNRPKPIRALVAACSMATVFVLVGVFSLSNHAFVYTPSMYPTIMPGSMVFIERQRHYHVGEVIEFHANGLLWVHRLIAIKADGDFVTKGDNPENRPDVFVPATTSADVVGAVVMSVPYLGFPELIAHHPSYGLGWLRAELGFYGRLTVVAMLGACAVLILLMKRNDDRSSLAEAGRGAGTGTGATAVG